MTRVWASSPIAQLTRLTMNLTLDPWIPVVQADGSSELLSLQDLFAQAHELHDLAVKTPRTCCFDALMRLLLCITQAALDGPVCTRWAYRRREMERQDISGG
jgi:CRISPR-associated protein Cse1 (CRISPR_cse1)